MHILGQHLQLHSIQILRLGDIEVDLDAVAAGQGHGSDQMGCDELAFGWGRIVKHSAPLHAGSPVWRHAA